MTERFLSPIHPWVIMAPMNIYVRMTRRVGRHGVRFALASVCMLATALFKNSPITLLVPAVDTILVGRAIRLPHPEKVPQFIVRAVDWLNGIPRLELLQLLIGVAVVFTVLKVLTTYGQTYLMTDVSHRVIQDLRNDLYSKFLRLSLRFYGKNRAGELVSRITYDTGVVRDAISEGLLDALFQPMELVVNIVILLVVRQVFGIPWNFILILTVGMPLVVYPIIRIGKALKKISHRSQGAMADLNSTLFETLSGIRVVQAFSMESYESGRFAKFNLEYYRTMMRQVSRNLMIQPTTEFAILLCACAIVWLGGLQVVEKEMSPGAFAAFAAALFNLSRPFKRLSRLHGINQTAVAAGERVFAVLDEPEDVCEVPRPLELAPLRKEISLRNVSFGYEGASVPAVSEVSLSVKSGEVVAFVGPSGSGKTTLLNLLPRFFDPASGEILIDGVNIREVSLKSLRQQIGIVTQETMLFNDSVSANIAYGRSEIGRTEIEKVARVANAHDFIQSLPQGYQTVIGDRGFKLSGGERQRIAIARAVLKNPPILILDEATSALDNESEKLVQEAIQHLMQGRTVLVIAHRLSTIRHANRIFVVEAGRITEEGTHEELLTRNGTYRRLYNLQFESPTPTPSPS